MKESTKTSETSQSQLLPRCSCCGADNAWVLLDTKEYQWWCSPCRDDMDKQFKVSFAKYRELANAEAD